MNKVPIAECDAASNSPHLSEPIEGLADHERISVIVDQAETQRPWSELRGLLSGEEGEKFARDIEEAFPTELSRRIP